MPANSVLHPATSSVLIVLAVLSTSLRAEEPTSPPPLQWFKGNLHTHSLWSDGDDFPEMIGDWYRERGYQFLALSDHNILAEGQKWIKIADVEKRGGPDVLPKYRVRFGEDWVETQEGDAGPEVRLKPLDEFRHLLEERGKFLMFSAEEISDKAEGVPVHLNATNLKEMIAPAGGATVREAIAGNLRAAAAQAKAKGREIIVHLNHPNYGYAVTAEDLAAVVNERFFEVYNGHPGVGQKGDDHHPPPEALWDIANTLRLAQLAAEPLMGVATDDSHNYHGKPGGARPGRGWIMVRARRLTPESLVRAILRGDFYASSGVTLRDVRYTADDRTLRLDIAPDSDATFVTTFIGTPVDFDGTSQPPPEKDGKPIRTTRKYSKEVGKVLATVEGLSPTHTLTGKELYVRAVVTSSRAPADPSFDGQKQQAWCQPVWEKTESGK